MLIFSCECLQLEQQGSFRGKSICFPLLVFSALVVNIYASIIRYGDWLERGKVASKDIIGEMSSSFNFGETLRICYRVATALNDTTAIQKYSTALLKASAYHLILSYIKSTCIDIDMSCRFRKLFMINTTVLPQEHMKMVPK